MFGVGLPEVAVILVVAAVLLGPERLPDYARQAARMIRALRQMARAATADLAAEFGPEYADLDLADLHPRALIRKHVLDDEDDAAVSA